MGQGGVRCMDYKGAQRDFGDNGYVRYRDCGGFVMPNMVKLIGP